MATQHGFGDGFTASQFPVCTGGPVIAVQFDGGVAVAADTLASYGKMARYRKVSRVLRVNDECLIAVAGDYADFQFLQNVIENKMNELVCHDPDAVMSPKALHSWLTAVLYNSRSKFNPFWNTYLVAGVQGEKKEPFLGSVNYLGMAYKSPFVATGMGLGLVQNMLEREYRAAAKSGASLSKDQAIALLRKSVEMLFYRDCSAHYEFEIGIVDNKGVTVQKPEELVTNWKVAEKVRGYD